MLDELSVLLLCSDNDDDVVDGRGFEGLAEAVAAAAKGLVEKRLLLLLLLAAPAEAEVLDAGVAAGFLPLAAVAAAAASSFMCVSTVC